MDRKKLAALAAAAALCMAGCGKTAQKVEKVTTATETVSAAPTGTAAPLTTAERLTTSAETTKTTTSLPKPTATKQTTSSTTTKATTTKKTAQMTVYINSHPVTESYQPPQEQGGNNIAQESEVTTPAAASATTTATTQTSAATEPASSETEPSPPQPEQPEIRSLSSFQDYTDWANEEGYGSGTLTAGGVSGINQDAYRTLPGTAAYTSGRIVVGDSRCCQMGIYEQVRGEEDFADFSVWGGHFSRSSSPDILGGGGLEAIRDCFETLCAEGKDCTVYLFATVNDYDYASNNNEAYITAAADAAAEIAGMRCSMNGEEVSPRVVVIGFDGCWDTAPLFGIPQEDFNRYLYDYSDRLRTALAERGLTEYTTVMEINGGKAGFIDDGLHYDEATLERLCGFVRG
ncbi:MAG: hypothetical protein IJ737_02810 [Ruminococcus sp.]|nr:hypothetical protein [Ruminococcus sp.]